MKRSVFVAAAMIGWAGAAQAATVCATADETSAFQVRHLQSKLMVAALACNQSDAYNNFVMRFQPQLTDLGGRLVGYYTRAGGTRALNQAITVLANAASQLRAKDPQGFCNAAWRTFWDLDQAPEILATTAALNVMTGIDLPAQCPEPVRPNTVKTKAPADAGPMRPVPAIAHDPAVKPAAGSTPIPASK